MTSQFNYQCLDSDENKEILSKNLLLLEDELRKRYKERLEIFNKENLEHNPEPFRFLKKENCTVLAFILPFEFDNSTCCEIFFLSTPNDRKVNVSILNDEDFSDLDSFNHVHSFFTEKILPQNGFDNSQIILSSGNFYNNLKSDYSIFSKSINIEQTINAMALNNFIINTIKVETQQFKEANKTPLSYFAKDAYKFPFSIIDLKPLISLVDDDDFTYQLDQAMASYHQNLFLPCAATLGVVLETLCIKIIKTHNIKLKTGDTQLGILLQKLREKRITTRRDHSRLEIAYRMRNLASHSNPGVTLKEDCHFMLNVINTIAFEYLYSDQ